jgi:hypothetical protein
MNQAVAERVKEGEAMGDRSGMNRGGNWEGQGGQQAQYHHRLPQFQQYQGNPNYQGFVPRVNYQQRPFNNNYNNQYQY